MILNLRLAKSIMEQEEGMNHLWIQLLPLEFSTIEKAEVSIQLPNGLYRMSNLNGYEEGDTNGIFINLSQDNDILLELYTQTAVDFDEASVIVTLSFKDTENRWKKLSKVITIRFVADEEMGETLELDQQVIERVKELRNHATGEPDSNDLVVLQPRIYELRNNKYAYFEKMYRVE
ncbi:hypothetical protein [Bacillus sp. FJAT-26390]|uniref:hypothetical protein n=1 Tax=Bacillus sp. FJAT-26390 TaxID=1743142 RepID=UPI000807E8B5|nr:hypothetical protein [Bacillus sp. FJAT-26390]OBZ17229.1 hypothetical protein A7975_04925 [Bacillus sp. FJAT-26390]